jgi:hypothetical protein
MTTATPVAEDIAALLADLDDLPELYCDVDGSPGWVYPDGTRMEDCPRAACYLVILTCERCGKRHDVAVCRYHRDHLRAFDRRRWLYHTPQTATSPCGHYTIAAVRPV